MPVADISCQIDTRKMTGGHAEYECTDYDSSNRFGRAVPKTRVHSWNNTS